MIMSDDELKNALRERLAQTMASIATGLDPSTDGKAKLRSRIEVVAARALPQWDQLSPQAKTAILDDLVLELVGLGPLEPLLHDSRVSEIMVNGPQAIYVERDGRVERVASTFPSADYLMTVIERMLAPTGRRVSESEPYVDARLPDGSRANVVVAPMALEGPYVTIRKLSKAMFSMQELIARGTLSPQAAAFLEACVKGRLNLAVSGPASAGKTTLLNVLALAIPAEERILILEDTAELFLPSHHVARLETRPANIEGKGEITLRGLVKNALHMRPDRIIVGEVRGGEALDMLQAMTTGHDGSMTTLHANHCADVLNRMAVMALTSMLELSDAAIERQVRSAIDLIVHIERFPEGTRRVTQISEVRKDAKSGEGALVDIYGLSTSGPPSQQSLAPTGYRPTFLTRLSRGGSIISNTWFSA